MSSVCEFIHIIYLLLFQRQRLDAADNVREQRSKQSAQSTPEEGKEASVQPCFTLDHLPYMVISHITCLIS